MYSGRHRHPHRQRNAPRRQEAEAGSQPIRVQLLASELLPSEFRSLLLVASEGEITMKRFGMALV